MTKSPLKLVPPTIIKRTVAAPGRKPNAVYRTREHLTGAEVDRLIDAAKRNRWGHRDSTMILVAFRHGLRSSEITDLRWDQIDFTHAVLHVRRAKKGTPRPANDPPPRQIRLLSARLHQAPGRIRPRPGGAAQGRRDFLNGGNWQLVEEHVEVESGKHDHNRPALHKALEACKAYGATLVIAKLDRLSRDAHFLLGLQKAGVKFVAADMPEANEMVVGIMALVAQAERRMISERTKAALQAAKARGVKLGNPKAAAEPRPQAAPRLRGQRGAARRPSPSGCGRCWPSSPTCRPTPRPPSWIAAASPPRAAASGRPPMSSTARKRLAGIRGSRQAP